MPLDNVQTFDETFAATFELAAIGLAHVTLDGQWVRVNRKFCEIVGYEESELLEMTFQQITHPDDLQIDLDLYAQLIRGEIRHYSLEKRYIRKDQRLIWIRLNVSLHANSSGQKIAIAVVEDIDERKSVERALVSARNELEERVVERTFALTRLKKELDSFFELNSDIMVILDTNGFYRRVNAALCGLLGYENHELCASDSISFVYGDDRARVSELRASAKRDLQPRYYESRHLTRAGVLRWIAWSEISIDSGEKSIFATGRDITAQKLQQQRATRTRRAMETRSKLSALGSMAANMAHEINNPLTVMLGEGFILRKMVERRALDESALARIANNVVTMGERIMTIVRGLQTAASDNSKDPFENVALVDILAQVTPFCRGNVNSENIEFVIAPYDPNLKIFCQPVQLRQIILNLTNNAYDAAAAGPPPRRVEIGVRLTQSRVEIRVSDSGDGIPDRIRDKLFEPFVTTKSKGQGLGLSLNLSKNMIRLQNGELYLDKVEAKTTFVISMPRSIKTHSSFST